jgi:hypothetical protein
MTVGNPENFRVNLISSGKEEIDRRVPCDFSNLTLDKVFKWIDSQQVNELIKSELKKSASRYPQQALKAWKNDYIRHLSRAQTKIRNSRKKEVKDIEEKNPQNLSVPLDNDFDNFDGDQE